MKLRKIIRNSQKKMSEIIDKKKNISYKIEDRVFLLIKNIDTMRLFKKLDYKMIESFKIIKKTEDSYIIILRFMTVYFDIRDLTA